MAYNINLTDGTIFATVSDGTINTDSSMVIVGKNYAGYGEFLGENFVRLLENGANATAPAVPLVGQMWFDTAAGLLKVYNGTTFKNLGAASAASTSPTSNVTGDMWFNTTTEQLYVYNGTEYILVGPAFTAGSGVSGSIVEVILDTELPAIEHTIVKLYTDDQIVAILSKDIEFIPAIAIPGFTTIKPGHQLASSVDGGTPLYYGTVTNSQLLDNIASSGFLSALTDDSTVGTLSVLNDNGLIVGVDSDFKVSLDINDHVIVENTFANKNLVLQVNGTADVITLNAATGRAEVAAPIGVNDIANMNYVDTAVGGAGSSALQRDGANAITGIILPDTDVTRDFGAASKRFATVYAQQFNGTATTAQYADLAERFEADTYMIPGTVVALGGAAEITTAMDDAMDEVFGVISTQAAFTMNAGAGTEETHPKVAMSGRVPVRVIGLITKGNRLVSAGNGLARAASLEEATSFNVIGRALENKTTAGEGTIEAIVTVN